MKRVLMIATGGTIASKKSDEGLKPILTSQDIINFLPDIKRKVWIDTVQLFNLDSTNISQKHWLAIAKKIEDHYDFYDGFVVCHGTDTMAYTASALSYLIQDSPKPIVLTGSQKPIDLESSDARVNLYDSFIYAADPDSSGVQIVFSGNVILGTRARKVNSKSLQAFASINYPLLAVIQGDTIIRYIRQEKTGDVRFFHELSNSVSLIKLYPGMKGDYLRFFLEKSDGVVIESFGVGGLPILEEYQLAAALQVGVSQGKTIVVTTQVQNEGSDMTIYQVGHHLKNTDGVLEAYDMTSEAVITKLMWILSQTKNAKKIKKLFYTPIAQDILFPDIR